MPKFGHPVPERLDRGVAKAQVVGNVEIGDQRGFLVDRDQPGPPRLGGRGDDAVLPADAHVTRIGLEARRSGS